jgi:hypothetical protein
MARPIAYRGEFVFVLIRSKVGSLSFCKAWGTDLPFDNLQLNCKLELSDPLYRHMKN